MLICPAIRLLFRCECGRREQAGAAARLCALEKKIAQGVLFEGAFLFRSRPVAKHNEDGHAEEKPKDVETCVDKFTIC